VDGVGSKALKLNPEQKIHFTFKLKNQQSGKLINRAQQVFAVLNNDKHEAVFVGKTSQKGYMIDISLTNSGLQSGEYDLSLVVGDAFIQNPFQKNVAKVTVHSRSSSSASEPTYSQPLPEIQHVFRQPEKRPDITISLAFTAAVLFPVLILLIGVSYSPFLFFWFFVFSLPNSTPSGFSSFSSQGSELT
jgi:oligosaccharyltransferase complex subunit delta (ribophorin II)